MIHRWVAITVRPMLAASLAFAPCMANPQGQDSAVMDWKELNEAVGQHRRGHVDILRWEQSQEQAASADEEAIPAFALATPADAIQAAWNRRRELASPLARLGARNVEAILAGDWGALDPRLQRHIHGVDDVLEVATHGRKAWIDAVATRQTLESLQNTVTAAEASSELARRMVKVGNWGRYQQAQIELAESSARMSLRRAQLEARQAEQALLKALRLETVHDRVALPVRLPEVPALQISDEQVRQRLAALQAQLPHLESRMAGNNAAMAYEAYLASREVHLIQREEVLNNRETIGEEILLRYNGMLDSVWDLLGDVGTRSQAMAGAILAQRDALLAETDLHWVLQGGQPDAFVSLGAAGESSASAAAGH